MYGKLILCIFLTYGYCMYMYIHEKSLFLGRLFRIWEICENCWWISKYISMYAIITFTFYILENENAPISPFLLLLKTSITRAHTHIYTVTQENCVGKLSLCFVVYKDSCQATIKKNYFNLTIYLSKNLDFTAQHTNTLLSPLSSTMLSGINLIFFMVS